MKYFAVVFCVAVLFGSVHPAPPPVSRTSVLDIFGLLEKVVENDGRVLLEKVVAVIQYVQEAVLELKAAVPKEYESIHKELNEIAAGLHSVYEQVDGLFKKKDVAYGFDLLDGLTELTGGTKLSTVLTLLSLADKMHRVINDAKEFVPHLEKTLKKMQDKLEVLVTDLAHQVLKEVGFQDLISYSIGAKIESLVDRVEEEAQVLILDLLHKMEEALTIIEDHLPEYYALVQHRVEEIRKAIHDVIQDIEKSIIARGFSILDLAGNVTGGTSLSTVFKVMSLIDKFNTCVQDVRNFGPRAEQLLEHSVHKVADRAQIFVTHVAGLLLKSA